MSAVNALQFAEFVGVLAGVIGVSVAVYLQLISIRDAPVEWVALFFLSGAALILVHPAPILGDAWPVLNDYSKLLGAVLAFLVEVALAAYVWHRYGVESPSECFCSLMNRDRPGS